MLTPAQVPEFRVSYTITTDKIDALYKRLKPKGVTLTALLAKAAGVALASHPLLYAGALLRFMLGNLECMCACMHAMPDQPPGAYSTSSGYHSRASPPAPLRGCVCALACWGTQVRACQIGLLHLDLHDGESRGYFPAVARQALPEIMWGQLGCVSWSCLWSGAKEPKIYRLRRNTQVAPISSGGHALK